MYVTLLLQIILRLRENEHQSVCGGRFAKDVAFLTKETNINPFMSNGLFYLHSLDRSIAVISCV